MYDNATPDVHLLHIEKLFYFAGNYKFVAAATLKQRYLGFIAANNLCKILYTFL